MQKILYITEEKLLNGDVLCIDESDGDDDDVMLVYVFWKQKKRYQVPVVYFLCILIDVIDDG